MGQRRNITRSTANGARREVRTAARPAITPERLDAIERVLSGLVHMAGGPAAVSRAAADGAAARHGEIVSGLVAAGQLAPAETVGPATAIVSGTETAPTGEALGQIYLQTGSLVPAFAAALAGKAAGHVIQAEGTTNSFTITHIFDAVPVAEAAA